MFAGIGRVGRRCREGQLQHTLELTIWVSGLERGRRAGIVRQVSGGDRQELGRRCRVKLWRCVTV